MKRKVNYITTIDDAPLYKGNWLVLARTNDRLENLNQF